MSPADATDAATSSEAPRPPTPRPVKLAVAALGGQGGGVLTDWLVHIAESCGWLAQATSVPGVAQRTGATLYYLEFFPGESARSAGRDPVMALMPVPGDVDCVLAAELAEAGRAIARGLVTAQRTTLIASSHRAYTIAERSAMGDGTADSGALRALAAAQAQRLILFDMDAIADRHHSVISSVLLGALCGAGVLPFPQASFEAAIRAGGIAVATNLRAFEDARTRAARGEIDAPGAPAVPSALPDRARTPALQGLLERIRSLPPAVQGLACEGTRRTLDYQDPEYAALYLTRLERLTAQGAGAELLEAVARSLALWMSFEDTIRVADLKTRAARFERVRQEQRVAPDAVLAVTDFLKPRIEEIAGSLPAALGRRLLAAARPGRRLAWLTRGLRLRTSTVSGFLLLYALAGCRRFRRRTLRFVEENARIEAWLAELVRLARSNPSLAAEFARAQRLIKGYGDTHERGWRNFCRLQAQLPRLEARPDGAEVLARLQSAALADEAGAALEREIAQLGRSAVAGPA